MRRFVDTTRSTARSGRGDQAAGEDAAMPVLPGAEAYSHDGGPTAVLLCHGFTGSPQSLRPWAEHLAAAGLTVSLPRLPGHLAYWFAWSGFFENAALGAD